MADSQTANKANKALLEIIIPVLHDFKSKGFEIIEHISTYNNKKGYNWSFSLYFIEDNGIKREIIIAWLDFDFLAFKKTGVVMTQWKKIKFDELTKKNLTDALYDIIYS